MKNGLRLFSLSLLTMSLSGGLVYAASNTMKYQGVDRNNDGVVTREEWRADSDKSFDKNDWNGDGVLSGDEVRPNARRPEGADPFSALDQNNNGSLSVEEFHQRAALDQLSELDHNSDGVISRAEWHYTARSFNGLDLNRDGKLNRKEN